MVANPDQPHLSADVEFLPLDNDRFMSITINSSRKHYKVKQDDFWRDKLKAKHYK